MGGRPVFRSLLEKIVKGVRDIRRPWRVMILAGVLFFFSLALLLSFSLSPAHISLVHGEEGPLIRLISHTDDPQDRKSTRLNSSHVKSSYAVFCLKKKNSTY